MRCSKAEKRLVLHAAGDLPANETALLLSHLEHCDSCRAVLARLQDTQAALGRIVAADTPEPLPADFSSRILLKVLEEKAARRGRASRTRKLFGWRPALALGAAAVAVFLAWGPVHEMIQARTGFAGLIGRTARPTRTLNPGEILWGAQIQLIGKIQGPCRLSDKPEPPDAPGIYAILHRPDPVNRPNVFAVDYIGQCQRLAAYTEYLAGQKDTLLTRAGSADSLFVVFYPMPESSEQERLELKNSLAARFEPYLTDKGGV